MVNIFPIDNFKPGDLQLIIFNQYSSVDDSQHCGAISNIQSIDRIEKIENVTNRVVLVVK